MPNKSIHFNLDPTHPKVLDSEYLSEVRFNLEVKSQQLDELEQRLAKLTTYRQPEQRLWLKENSAQIAEMVEEFVDEAVESFDSMVLDENLAVLGAEFSRKLRLVVDQTQSLLESLEKGI